MGRANPILHIVIEDKWDQHPAIVALREKGHQVYRLSAWVVAAAASTAPKPDLWLLENAHHWTEVDWDYLEAALATARARRKGKKT